MALDFRTGPEPTRYIQDPCVEWIDIGSLSPSRHAISDLRSSASTFRSQLGAFHLALVLPLSHISCDELFSLTLLVAFHTHQSKSTSTKLEYCVKHGDMGRQNLFSRTAVPWCCNGRLPGRYIRLACRRAAQRAARVNSLQPLP